MPLKRARARYPIEVDLRRNYGFVHTSEEALQLLKFLQGEKSFSDEVTPLVFRNAKPEQFEAEQWQPSDLHVIEVSSSKRISFGPDVVQGNYVQHHFPDFFADRERARTYWNLVKRGHRVDLIDFLESQPTFRMLSEDDRRLLSGLAMDQQSFKMIAADMSEMVERLGRERVVFVTHVNAVTEDGALIPTRERLIRWVNMAAAQLDVPVFDPTSVLEEFGQEAALERAGADLTHYTLPFSDRIYDELHRMHVQARLSAEVAAGGEDQQLGMLASQLESSLERGDFLETSRRIHQAAADAPDSLPLIELRGMVRARIGDYAGALADLNKRGDEAMLSQGARMALLDALAHEGEHARALGIAEGLLDDEVESATLYNAAAIAAEGLGRPMVAARYFKEAFRRNRRDLSIALHALELLAVHGDPVEGSEWRKELLGNIGPAASGAFELASWALKNSDEELFSAAIAQVSVSDKGGTVDLAEDVFAARLPHALAAAVEALPTLGNLSPALAERRLKVMEQALAWVADLLGEGRVVDAYALAQELVSLDSSLTTQIHGERIAAQARRLIRDATLQVRAAVRAAYAEGDKQQIAVLGLWSRDMLVGDPDTAVIVARALRDLERTTEALGFLKQVQAANPSHFGARRWTGRLAAQNQDYATALSMYASLAEYPDYPAVKPEAERFFAGADRRSFKRMRELSTLERYDEALELAEAVTRQYGPLERTERELKIMHRGLRLQLKDIDDGIAESGHRERLMRLMARIRPDDARILRRLAVEIMRQNRFGEAAEIWSRIHSLNPNDEIAQKNRVRCATLAERRSFIMATEVTDVG